MFYAFVGFFRDLRRFCGGLGLGGATSSRAEGGGDLADHRVPGIGARPPDPLGFLQVEI